MLSVLVAAVASPLIAAAGSPPAAVDDGGFQTAVNTSLQIQVATLLANDSDPDGGPVSLDADAPPYANNGSVFVTGDTLVYTPNPGFTGSDAITYQIEDGEGLTDTALASVFVFAPNTPPVAVNDDFLMGFNQTLIVQASSGLLVNDYDPDGNPIALNGYDSSGVPGTLAVQSDGGFGYTPPIGFEGTVQFTYSVTDGTNVSNAALATIIVQNASTPPTANDDAYATPKDTVLSVPAPGVLGNDGDADEQPLSATLVQAPASGTLDLLASGGFTYTPNPGFTGLDSFQYRAFDGSLFSGIATVSISVSGPNVPPVANGDAFQTGRDTAIAIAFSDLLANDTDAEGAALSVLADQIGATSQGTLVVEAANGRVVYTPNTGFIGVDTFTYRITDGIDASAQPATVRITVTNLVGGNPTVAPTATATAPATSTPGTGTGGTTTGTTPYGVTTLPSVGTGPEGGIGGWWLPGLLAAVAAGAALRELRRRPIRR